MSGKHRRARGAPLAKFHELRAIKTDRCVIWPYGVSSSGYGTVRFNGANHGPHRLALILASRIDPPADDVAHGPCRNRLCMNVRHLRWASRTENEADKIAAGVANVGERHGSAKLTEAEVNLIRESKLKGRELSSMFAVNESCISKVRNGLSWRHLAEPTDSEFA